MCRGGIDGAGNINADPLFGPLGTYGGQTRVYPLLPGSAALDAGIDSAVFAARTEQATVQVLTASPARRLGPRTLQEAGPAPSPAGPAAPTTASGQAAITASSSGAGCPATDQRGIGRPQGSGCDMGTFESQGFTLTKTGGDHQSTALNTTIPISLTLGVSSSHGEPVNGGQVTFAVPASGAGATLIPNPGSVASGQVSVTAQANDQAGAYAVQAGARGAAPVSFDLINRWPVYLPLTVR